jgi:hypothetical protein
MRRRRPGIGLDPVQDVRLPPAAYGSLSIVESVEELRRN